METLDHWTIENSGKIVTAGDTVMMRTEDPEEPPYVALVEEILREVGNDAFVRVRWYYRPEESICGRREFHGTRELFLSDHFDIQSAAAIADKCTVHSFADYTVLDAVGDRDYYSRFDYEATTGKFTPENVQVHCICETPYNPDDIMLKCEAKECGEWFHLDCMNLDIEAAKAQDHFYCPDCDNRQANPIKYFPISIEPESWKKNQVELQSSDSDQVGPQSNKGDQDDLQNGNRDSHDSQSNDQNDPPQSNGSCS